ncbi:hypothetical protein VNO77_05306 [Canavalia gladiata]|uniref:Uncharacterized protein n=1 Tax=Canavalia gladiata TaxID=3824 RepID=A0AAN9MY36_CANGL
MVYHRRRINRYVHYEDSLLQLTENLFFFSLQVATSLLCIIRIHHVFERSFSFLQITNTSIWLLSVSRIILTISCEILGLTICLLPTSKMNKTWYLGESGSQYLSKEAWMIEPWNGHDSGLLSLIRLENLKGLNHLESCMGIPLLVLDLRGECQVEVEEGQLLP